MKRFINTFYFLIVLAISTGISQGFAQESVPESVQQGHGFWLERMQEPDVNFYDLQSSFYRYWSGRSDYKGNGYKVFKRWEYINESRVLPDGKLQSPDFVLKEYKRYMSANDGVKSAAGNWSISGPTQYFINNTGQPTGMGRINAIAFHPTDVNTIYIGAPSGGIWKTTNGGGTWENLTGNLPKLGVSSILVHPTNPDIVYIGTGDRDGGDAPGIGVFKTVDGGITWNQINNTMGNVIVGDMLMHPSDPEIIIAATSTGIYKTTNGGATWSLTSTFGHNIKDIQFKPGDPSVVYAVRITTPSRFYRSTNTGDTWTQITTGIPSTGIGSRMVIGTSPANPSCVYLVQIKSADGTFANFLRSTDAGLSFTSMSTTPNIMGYNCDGSGTASQATYDLCINVDPVNANTVFVGGINTWKSTDGGVTWNSSTNWSGNCSGTATAVHADHHVLVWNPLNGALYLGHDGGITYTANGGTSWTEITGGLPISQIYRLGQGTSNSNYTLIGLQDNGSAATTNGSTFYTTRGGDGTECVIDHNNSNYCYNTYVYGDLSRSVTGPEGAYANIGSEGTNGIDEAGPWVLPFFLHKTDPNTMFAGYKNVWRTVNVREASAGSVLWAKISSGETADCKVLEQSEANPDVIYVVRNGSIKRTDNANDVPASVTWTACALPDGLTPTYLETHPTNADVVYATAGNSVYVSVNKGLTWTDMDPNFSLPDLYTNCIVFDKYSNEGLYIGNQTGVWFKDAGMADWILFSNGLPPVDVRELEIFYDPVGTQNRLKAATYGRGLWQSDLFESGVLNPAGFTAEVSSNTRVDLRWILSQDYNVMLAFNTSPSFGTPVDGTTYTTTIPGGGTVLYNGGNATFGHTSLSSNTTYYYKIWSYDESGNYSSGSTAHATTTYSQAEFSADNSNSCTGSLTVTFTDASLGAWNSWAWDVDNDGTTDYTTQNPTHTYNSPGLYSVKLSINNGEDEIIKENLILVTSSAPTANTGCTLSSNNNIGNGYGIGIYRFALGNIDYPTSSNDGYYQNYTCLKWTALELNKTYNVTVQTGTANNEGARVYIDYNDNGIFEAGESVASFPSNKTGTRTLSFTVPSTGVVLDKALRLRVLSRFNAIPSNGCDISSYGQAEDYTVLVVSDATWTGSASSEWATSGNWNIKIVPVSGAKIKIPTGAPNYPVLTGSVTCSDLTIMAGASLTINPGKTLTVNGLLTNHAGASGLVVKSDAGSTGSLIHENSGVQATIERNVGAYTSGDTGWHLISSPVENQEISGDWTPSSSIYDFYAFDESLIYGYWLNQKVPANNMTHFIPGKGYLVAYENTAVKTFEGAVNVTGLTLNGLTNTTSGSYPGWHLTGNPFASAIDWNSGSWTKTNIDGIMQVWNSQASSYQTSIEVGGIVPSMNGFMVHTSGNGLLGIPADSRLHSSVNWYKSTDDFILLKANDLTGHTSQSSIVRFNPQASEGFDNEFDSYFLAGFAPMFYSRTNEGSYSLNTLPLQSNELVVPFDFVGNGNDDFNIELAKSLPGSVIYLTDLKLNTVINLTESPVYRFSSAEGDLPGRFLLTFGSVGVDNPEVKQVSIYAYRNLVFIKGAGPGSDVTISTLQGQQLFRTKAGDGGVEMLNAGNIATGVYLVNVISTNGIVGKKVMIIN